MASPDLQKIKAVVFDIGGVLERNPQTGWQEKWEKELQLEAGELNSRCNYIWRAGSTGTFSLNEVYRHLVEALGLSDSQLRQFMEDIWAEYIGELNPDMAEYFRSLHASFQTGIISNSFVGAREKEQARFKIEEYADIIIYSHEVGLLKPNPAIYLLCCRRLGVAPEEVVFLDDKPENVTAAEATGMHAILFENSKQAIADLELSFRR